jgi:uncharacterized RDD family membrane protein YckC
METVLVTALDEAQADAGQTRFLTGEAVHLDIRVARVGSRMVARLIDLFVQVVLTFVVSSAMLFLLGLLALFNLVAVDDALLGITSVVVSVVTFLGYPIYMETLLRGRTAGKAILGLRVVRDDGGPITFRHALTRGLVGTAVEFPGVVGAPMTWVITLWTMIANPRSRRIGDQVAGTVVIHERTPAAWGWAPSMPPGLADWAATLDLAGLDDDLALVVRHYLARNRWLREPARSRLGLRLAQEVAAVTNPPAPPNTPGWAYLAAVHAERHRRAQRQLAAARGRAAAVWPDLTAVTAAPSADPRLPPVQIPPPREPAVAGLVRPRDAAPPS